MRFLLVATVKDEGPHILEWVAHHKRLGFNDIVVYQNGSTDLTQRTLKALAAIGEIQYFPNEMIRRFAPYQNRAMRRASWLDVYKDSDWCMALDGDEFLHIKTPQGTVQSLVDEVENRAGRVDEIKVNWRVFGNSRLKEFDSRLMTERFTLADHKTRVAESLVGVKTLFRTSSFLRPGVHVPKEPFFENTIMSNGSGLSALEFSVKGWRATDPAKMEIAQVNHYMVRDVESFLLKATRGSGHHPMRKINQRYWALHNFNQEEDLGLHLKSADLFEHMKNLDEKSNGRLLGIRNRSIFKWRKRIEEIKKDQHFNEMSIALEKLEATR